MAGLAGYVAGGVVGGALLYAALNASSPALPSVAAPPRTDVNRFTDKDADRGYIERNRFKTDRKAPVATHDEAPMTLDAVDFELHDQYGNSFRRDDLDGNFTLFTFVRDWGDDEAVGRLVKTTHGSDRKSNYQYMRPNVVLIRPNVDGRDLQRKVHEVWPKDQEQASDRMSSRGKTYDRLLAVFGDDAPKVRDHFRKAAQALVDQEPVGLQASPTPAQREKQEAVPGVLYLVNPDTAVIGVWGHDMEPNDIASEVAEHIRTFALSHPVWNSTKAVKPRLG
jgi:hypothetical protein